MPPTTAHFNGGVNLADAETVMREIAARVPSGVSRITDGETGDRRTGSSSSCSGSGRCREWTDADAGGRGLRGAPEGAPRRGHRPGPDRVETSATPRPTRSPTRSSTARAEGTSRPACASRCSTRRRWPRSGPAFFPRTGPGGRPRTRGDVRRPRQALAALPHDRIAVQWDVAVEFGLLEGAYGPALPLAAIAPALVRCIEQVPADVPVGLHLCYGDYGHEHFKQPESLRMQVDLVNALTAAAARPLDWASFTVPQARDDADYFAPLADLRAAPETELYFALVPYHPGDQPEGTTAAQKANIDAALGGRSVGHLHRVRDGPGRRRRRPGAARSAPRDPRRVLHVGPGQDDADRPAQRALTGKVPAVSVSLAAPVELPATPAGSGGAGDHRVHDDRVRLTSRSGGLPSAVGSGAVPMTLPASSSCRSAHPQGVRVSGKHLHPGQRRCRRWLSAHSEAG